MFTALSLQPPVKMSKTSLQWSNLKYELQPWIKTAIEVMGFDLMTPVQASTIPMFAGNKDVVVDSVTGSGKTIAFVIPILEKIISEDALNTCKKGHFHSVIISPTRELAKQIQQVINSFLDHYTPVDRRINCQLLVGTNERTIRDDYNAFIDDKPVILVGTPGRIWDFINLPNVKTNSCSMVVLDEADRLLDISFIGDVEKILKNLPKQRRTGLFSATIDAAGLNIFKTGLRNPVKIKVSSGKNESSPSSLKLNYVVVDPQFKFQQLLHLLNNFKFKKCIVYFPTCISVTFFYKFIQFLQRDHPHLVSDQLNFFSLHGKLQTSSRLKTLDSFTQILNDGVLLTTDVAARGIDIPDVDLVVQLDPPTDSDIFLHRCGRTGRANKIGKAITFINQGREEDYIDFMEVKNIVLQEETNILNDSLNRNSDDSFYQLFVKWILGDRDRFDLAIKSYVAFIRHYCNHSTTSIFRLQTFDFVALGKMHGLFRLPRMPEITKHMTNNTNRENIDDTNFGDGWIVEPSTIDLDKFAYLDKRKEEKRQKELANLAKIQDKKRLKFELKKKNMAWSNKTDTKEGRAKRREKMELKRKAIEEEILKDEQNDEPSDSEVIEDWKDTIMANKRRKKQNDMMQGSFDDL